MAKPRLRRFSIRYYPPGFYLEYTEDKWGEVREDIIDLPNLESGSVSELPRTVDHIMEQTVGIIPNSKRHLVEALLQKLIAHLADDYRSRYFLFHTLRAHEHPVSKCVFNKGGDQFLTSSYDRTVKLWDTETATEVHTLVGHTDAVYTVAFNTPFGDRIVSGGKDRSFRLWDAASGECIGVGDGLPGAVVALQFQHQSQLFAGGCDTGHVMVWNAETAEPILALDGLTDLVSSLHFNQRGDLLLAGCCDSTCRIWDMRSGSTVSILNRHRSAVTNAEFNFMGTHVLSSAEDGAVQLWDMRRGDVLFELQHPVSTQDELSDDVFCTFSTSGSKIAATAIDNNVRIFDSRTGGLDHVLHGHQDVISRVAFSPSGSRLLSASRDRTAKVWAVANGALLQSLEGHSSEILTCSFNYSGDVILTGSHDSSCCVWKS